MRLKSNLAQQQVAERLTITRTAIGKYENENAYHDVEKLIELAKIYNCSVDFLLRGDIAFAQACLETGNFTFAGSAVKIEQNNFCGMGVTSTGMKGNSFDTPRAGVRAHIQHLKAYVNTEPFRSMGNPIDPRFALVKRGSAPYVERLGQKENPTGAGWATGAGYGAKILKILKEMLDMPLDTVSHPADVQDGNQPSVWAAEAWTWGIKHGITDGSNPQGVPTREQVVQMIRNYYKMQTGY